MDSQRACFIGQLHRNHEVAGQRYSPVGGGLPKGKANHSFVSGKQAQEDLTLLKVPTAKNRGQEWPLDWCPGRMRWGNELGYSRGY